MDGDFWRKKKKKKKFLFVTLLVIWYACYFHGQRREAGGDVVMGFWRVCLKYVYFKNKGKVNQ